MIIRAQVQPAGRAPDFAVQIINGRFFRFDAPEVSCRGLEIEHVAHALAHLCRFGGHIRTFYSVAQHSILVAEQCAPENRLVALMHDAAEFVIGDVVTPLKRMIPEIGILEDRIFRAIARHFGLEQLEIPEEVRWFDRVLLATERRDLHVESDVLWSGIEGVLPLNRRIVPEPAHVSRAAFAARFHEYRSLSR